ncbi:hypothetical protein [Scytonema sp. NUACC26]|uniref:hypothetical protein n=1 Tax=Scytonema sp. NUACC26 TaxID=3140176 RepID=UPI0034DB9889
MTLLNTEFKLIQGSDGVNDNLFGTAVNEQIFGQAGDDTLHGGDGNDIDLLFGGMGNDTLKGSVGADFYFFNDPTAKVEYIESNKIKVTSFEGIDIIENFNENEDAIYVAENISPNPNANPFTKVPPHDGTGPVNPPIFIEYRQVLGFTSLAPGKIKGNGILNKNLTLGSINPFQNSLFENKLDIHTINHLNTSIFDIRATNFIFSYNPI